jgi:simple sugar transport system ATP-binding protein
MNILYGLYRPDEGQVFLDSREVHIRSPHDAISQGIGMVHQHFMLIPVMTVAENVILGMEITRNGPFLDRATATKRIREFSHQYGLDVDPAAYVKDLPVGVRQRVEIVKALYRGADILALDEPTAVLTPQESEELFRIMRSLVAQGKSIIFITHKLKEVFAVADRITVLRDGRVVGTTTPEEATESKLAAMMVGREVILTVDKKPAQPGEMVLQVENLQVLDDRGYMAVDGVSLAVRAGEILGIAGVQGNGQTELVEALTGLRPPAGGKITILGDDVTLAPPRETIEQGLAHIPEDRHKHGLVLSFPLVDNLVLSTYYRSPFAKGLALDERAIDENGRRVIAEFDVRTPSEYALAGTLSGGNQQKLIVAREFSRPINVLIAAQPTRGLDVGSIEFIHQKLVERRDAGCAILLVSVELDEIMSLSDRIAVLYRGKIIETMPVEQATPEGLGLLMAGVR